MKVLKKISYLSLILVSIFIFKLNANAATASISVRSSANTVIYGRSVNVTVTVSSSAALGSWEYTLGYDTSKLRLNSGTQHVVDYGDGAKTTVSYTYSFTTIGTGSAYVGISSSAIADYSTEAYIAGISNGSTNINIITQAQLEASYSSNNYLSGLAIDGATITPEFNKDTKEYSVELDSMIEKINVSATLEDNTASLEGAGEIAVSEGINTITLTVTAQNGNVRTYIINVLVKELNPLYVTVDNKKYSLVKKKELLKAPNNYTESIVTIKDTEIPVLVNEITKYTLVGLKDEKGNIELYIYNVEDESYIKYNEINFTGIKLFYMQAPKNDYKKSEIKINGIKVPVYKKEGTDYYLIYGMNVETGKINWYRYESDENTIQKYIDDDLNITKEKNNNYLFLIIVLSSMIGLLFIFMLILLIKYNKLNNKKID